MPVGTPTELATAFTGGGGTGATTVAVTPNNNALLVILQAWGAESGSVDQHATPVSNTNFTVDAWTQVIAPNTAIGSGNLRLSAYMAQTTTSAEGTVTCDLAGGVDRFIFHVIEIQTGFNTSTPIIQSKIVTADDSGTALLDTLDSTPDADSVLLGINMSYTSGDGDESTEPTGWTKFNQYLSDFSSNFQHADGDNGTQFGCTWEDARTGGLAILGLEVQASVTGAPIVPVETHGKIRQYRRLKAI